MSRSALRALRLFACVLGLTGAAGCGNACLSLATQICNCLPDDGNRAACNDRAKQSQEAYPVRSQDEAYCQKQLDTHACDCHVLATAQGKLNCGLAYSPSP